jgi:hypothetical protein
MALLPHLGAEPLVAAVQRLEILPHEGFPLKLCGRGLVLVALAGLLELLDPLPLFFFLFLRPGRVTDHRTSGRRDRSGAAGAAITLTGSGIGIWGTTFGACGRNTSGEARPGGGGAAGGSPTGVDAAATAASGGGASGWAFFLIRTCPRRGAAPSAAGSVFGAYLRINAATTSSSSVLMWFLSTVPCFARSARSSLLVFPNCLASSKTLMADPF